MHTSILEFDMGDSDDPNGAQFDIGACEPGSTGGEIAAPGYATPSPAQRANLAWRGNAHHIPLGGAACPVDRSL